MLQNSHYNYYYYIYFKIYFCFQVNNKLDKLQPPIVKNPKKPKTIWKSYQKKNNTKNQGLLIKNKKLKKIVNYIFKYNFHINIYINIFKIKNKWFT